RRQVRLNHLQNFRLRHRADPLINHLTTLEKKQRRNTADAIPHRRARVVVCVQLTDLDLTGIFGRNRVDRRSHCATGSAPWCPKGHKDRDIRTKYVLIKCTVGKSKSVFSSHSGFGSPSTSVTYDARSEPKDASSGSLQEPVVKA